MNVFEAIRVHFSPDERDVARGWRLLEETAPGFQRKLLPAETLSVSDPYNCPLYRVYGGYTSGLHVLGLYSKHDSQWGFAGESHNAAWRRRLARWQAHQ